MACNQSILYDEAVARAGRDLAGDRAMGGDEK